VTASIKSASKHLLQHTVARARMMRRCCRVLKCILQKLLLSQLPLGRCYSINRTLTQTTFTFLQFPFNFIFKVTTSPQYKTNADMEGTD